MNVQGLGNRMVRAAKLNVHLYEEVEADRGAFGQAMLVVVLSSLAAGVGGAATGGIGWLFVGTLAALGSWFVWAWLVYLIGTKVLPEPHTRSDIGELLRVTGFSSAPGVIRVLGIIPGLATLVTLIAAVWMLVAMVIAVRQALDYSGTGRAVGVCLIGWLVQVAVLFFLLLVFGPTAPGV
jgi:hypothetical protein